MYNSQSSPQRGGSFSSSCGGHRAARRAAKRAKFEAWMQAKANRHGHFSTRSSAPAVNVKESDDHFEIQVFAPGFTKDAFDISLSDNRLTIAGKAPAADHSEGNWRRQEFVVQDFERKFELNDKIDPDEITAEYNHGILSLSLKMKPGEERIKHSIAVD